MLWALMRASTSASQAWGSISLSLAVWISVSMTAARSPPRSEPANSHDLRPSAISQSFCPYRGAPQVSLAALCSLRELLIACESRLVSGDGNIVTQEAQDGSAVTARTKDGAGLPAHSSDGTTPARSRSRRRTISGHDTGGALSRAESDGAAPARGGGGSKRGGQR